MSKLDAAIRFAAERHEGQWRDGEFPLPYITHPVEVLLNLRNVGQVTDEDMLVAAVLHDLQEETPTTNEEICSIFGNKAAILVSELTRVEPLEIEIASLRKEQIFELRTQYLLQGIEEMSIEAKAIKLADRLSNLREAKRTRSEGRVERYKVQTKRILKFIPESVNPALWRAVRAELR